MSKRKNLPSVIVISSHVARGSVGNRAAVFALEAHGFPVWAVPTVILPWHPGHGPATRLEHDAGAFCQFFGTDIANAPWIDEVSAILTGYMANARQIMQVAELVKTLKSNRPDLTYLCDPVIGDKGGLYVADDTAEAMKSHLVPLADIVTPNRFELEWLASGKMDNKTVSSSDLANKLLPPTKLITSYTNGDGLTGNLLVSEEGCYRVSHSTFESPPNGPGDLTASVFLGASSCRAMTWFLRWN